jgi:hypothetical protein
MPDYRQLQLQRELWQVSGKQDQRAYLLARLKGLMVKAHAEAYLESVIEAWEEGCKQPGKLHKMWAAFVSEKQLKLVALEALTFVVDFLPADSHAIKRLVLADVLGRHLEYSLWLSHPVMQGYGHGRAGELVAELRRLGGHDLGLKSMRKRLTRDGFHLSQLQQELTPLETQALGMLFLQLILPLGIVEVVMVPDYGAAGPRSHSSICFAPAFWERLSRWKQQQARVPRHMPMAVPPQPWSGPDDGGYLGLPGKLLSCPDDEWGYRCSRIQPVVLEAVNRLQQQAFRLDKEQVELVRILWRQYHPVGELPSRDRMMEPKEVTFFETAEERQAWWAERFRWRKDVNQDPNRLRAVANIVVAERLIDDGTPIHFIHNMDLRGRIYPRGGTLTYSQGELYRSWFTWDRRVPVRGNELALAYAIGEYRGTGGSPRERLEAAIADRQLLAAIGERPEENLSLWADAKSPFRLVQAAREWVAYCRDQSHTTGIVVGLDQKTSGFGHLACLMRDAEMAEMANVTGTRDFDVYALVGERARELLLEAMEDPDTTDGQVTAMRWWLDHWPDRKLFKKAVMPMLYGRSYVSLNANVADWLAEKVGQYHTEEGYRVVMLAHVLSKRLWVACKETFPQVRNFTRWMGRYATRWIDRDADARWITPNGLVVDRYTRERGYQTYKLPIRGKRVTFTARDVGGLKKPHTWGGHCADLIHSMDAAFCQRAVAWYPGREIVSIHDCFLTTIDQLWPMRDHLLNTYRDMYQQSWLEVIDAYQWDEKPVNRADGLDRKSSTKVPIVGTLEVERIGENPHLFG